MDPHATIANIVKLTASISGLITESPKLNQNFEWIGAKMQTLLALILPLQQQGSATLVEISAMLTLGRVQKLLTDTQESLEHVKDYKDKANLFPTFFSTKSSKLNGVNTLPSDLQQQFDSVLIEVNVLETTRIRQDLARQKSSQWAAVENLYSEEPPMSDALDARSVIGQGVLSIAHRMRNVNDGRIYAVKRVKLSAVASRTVTKEMLLRECAILERLSHPHITRYFLNFDSKGGDFFNIVLELIDGVALAEKITCSAAPTEAQVVEWGRQMALALSYMHGEGVLHRDLNPDNVMLTARSKVKIIGFGQACCVTEYAESTVGARTHASFEKLTGLKYDGRDDVWALGCILLELLLRTRYD
jgi:tRNA A-37 threonylcarbamoyl transferase component Bud32